MEKKPKLDKKLMDSLKRIPSAARTAKGNKLVKEAIQEKTVSLFLNPNVAIWTGWCIAMPYTVTFRTHSGEQL